MLAGSSALGQAAPAAEPAHPVAVAFRASSLGLGGEVAVGLSTRTNLRAGFSAFNYSRNFDRDGIFYDGQLQLRSMDVVVDFFPTGGGFHVSPGALLYNGNQVRARAN